MGVQTGIEARADKDSTHDSDVSTGSRESLIYLYGFTTATDPLELPVTGIEGEVEWIEAGAVRAIVSQVPAATFEEEPLQAHLEDVVWLTDRANRHNDVLQKLLAQTTVVPCRFGTLFRDRGSLIRLMENHHTQLAATLRRLDGRTEWSVKAYTTRPPKPASKRVSGADFLLQKKRLREAERGVEQRACERAEKLLSVLENEVEDVCCLPLNDLGAPERNGRLILNLACLLPRSESTRLESTLQALAERTADDNLVLRWSGPWPAYSFVGDLFVRDES